MQDFKVGDRVMFNPEHIEQFKRETHSDSKEIQQYRMLVLDGVDQKGSVLCPGEIMTNVQFDDGWDLPIPTKHLVLSGYD